MHINERAPSNQNPLSSASSINKLLQRIMLHLVTLNVYKQPELLYCSNLSLKAIRFNILLEEQKEKFI